MNSTLKQHTCAWLLGAAIAVIASAPAVVGMQAQSPASTPPAGSAAEGINIHGHWTVDIRNPDGSLVSHHEFDNALANTGSSTLAAILGRTRSVGTWGVVLQPTSGNSPCELNGGPNDCVILEPTNHSFPNQANRIFRNLALAVVDGTVRLSGQATSTFAAQIGRVQTISGICAATVAPTECDSPLEIPTFTSHIVTPIPVAAGQIVQVTVVLSFS